MHEFPGQTIHQSNRAGVEFLVAEATVGLTFLDVAETTSAGEVRTRNLENARTAFETVQRLLPRVFPSGEKMAFLETKLAELKCRLAARGIFPDSVS